VGSKRSVSLALLALLSLWAARPAAAVVIVTGDGSGNTTAPPDDPGWANVGYLGSASAVYLGDGFVLTDAHVGVGDVTFGGVAYTPVAGSGTQLQNPSGTGLTQYTDLELFRLTTDPDLPALQIVAASPAIGASVTMIGAGNTRDPDEVGWQRVSNDGTVTWTQVAAGQGDINGYYATGSRTMRWGMNTIYGNETSIRSSTGLDIFVLSTYFTENSPTNFEAQVVSGDSGGGLFTKVDNQWQLAGILNSIGPLSGQPNDSAVFGDLSYSVDLSKYRQQIETIMNSATHPWTNPTNNVDVNGDGAVTPLDALVVINELNSVGAGPLPSPPATPPPYYDVNGDGSLSPADALYVINWLNMGSTPKSITLEDIGASVPEPSSFALAAIAALALAGLHLLSRRRSRRSEAESL